ncbi:MAG TPA: CpsD/CapB family tyrosine-protein kinase [Candidatus Baltobacteraceae bacterium]|nr:CpsD/CapB family tyrosine-protein kinase [Candidatus Baltobacteraceae bacterium]
MSKNFELMLRAGKSWEVAPAVEIEKPARPERVEGPKPVERVQPVQHIVPIRKKHWDGRRRRGRLDIDQLAREESFHLIQRIFFLQTQTPPRVVVFAGIDHGNGCSRICSQAAEALEGNSRGTVCLVDANFRTPSLSRVFNTTNHHGFSDSLAGEGPIRSFAKPLHTDSLWLLSSGSLAGGDSHGLLNSVRLKARFEELRNEFDYVLVDAPPLTHYSDAIALARVADGFVLVLEANSTRREAAVRISENLRAAQIRVLGAVLNKREFPIPDALYRKL